MRGSDRRDATIHEELMACDEGAFARCQEQHGIRDILKVTDAAKRNSLDGLCAL